LLPPPSCLSLVLFSRTRPPPSSTLFPYTTLFRSNANSRWRGSEETSGSIACPSWRIAQAPAKSFEVIMIEDTPSPAPGQCARTRSEEHTSELQSLTNLVCRLLLEKKKTKQNQRP